MWDLSKPPGFLKKAIFIEIAEWHFPGATFGKIFQSTGCGLFQSIDHVQDCLLLDTVFGPRICSSVSRILTFPTIGLAINISLREKNNQIVGSSNSSNTVSLEHIYSNGVSAMQPNDKLTLSCCTSVW